MAAPRPNRNGQRAGSANTQPAYPSGSSQDHSDEDPQSEDEVEKESKPTATQDFALPNLRNVDSRRTLFEPIWPSYRAEMEISDRAELHRLSQSFHQTQSGVFDQAPKRRSILGIRSPRQSYVGPQDPSRMSYLSQRSAVRQSYMSTGESMREDLESLDQITEKPTLEGIDAGHPMIDPVSGQFDVYKWTKFMVRSWDNEGIVPRKAGVVFEDVNVSGSGAALALQPTMSDPLMMPLRIKEMIAARAMKSEKKILRNFDLLLKSGELLVVLGRPGSGCSTMLKTMCGHLHGLNLANHDSISYNGISQAQMIKEFKGDVVYNQETDLHFPHLTTGQTLTFAAAARTPQARPQGMTRAGYSEHMARVVAAIFGLSHTWNTRVGDNYIRGVSGGERKRVSIAEMALANSAIACWDNSTRGLDAATALEFARSLRLHADLAGSCHAVAIYQASQAIYDTFDKCIVLYEGREIYYGSTKTAEKYFVDMGYVNPPRQTTGDFLTSVTNPGERKARPGYENKVPRTPDEFVQYWKQSREYQQLMSEIAAQKQAHPVGSLAKDFQESKVKDQAKHTRPQSAYMISIPMQLRLCIKRAYQRVWNDKTSTVTTSVGQLVMALIIGSIFYGTANDTDSFFAKGAVLFLAVLLSALVSMTEINGLFSQRAIIEKQKSYRFAHPAAEAFAGILSDLPVKFFTAVPFNIVLYFLGGLRYEPSQFFIFFLFTFMSTITMSGIFRSIAAGANQISMAMAIAGVMVLIIIIYSGFMIPGPVMHVWFSWLRWINPIYYAFEALMSNEFHGRQFPCAPASLVPQNYDPNSSNFICGGVVGAVAGQDYVEGDNFINLNYNYFYSHIWRNLGIMIAFLIFFEILYIVFSELNNSAVAGGEFLVFRRGHVPKHLMPNANGESIVEPPAAGAGLEQSKSLNMEAQKDIFTWRNVQYVIPYAGAQRTLLDNVSGWVKPGTLTALMGVSGAGKTTLLDVLAHRVTMGVVTGDMLVNGRALSKSFQRSTGYVQQQDLHLATSTVRESLRFSAILRQPAHVSKAEKFDYVEEVIKMLNMEDFAEAVVGAPGSGLNVEQRKLLSIGVELAAKPALLLFLDEPTSGLDSQSSWAICAFLRKLANNGQAVLATIHQPSAILFQEFDRLLFLAKGGKTVYFGDIGEQSRTLLDYFEKNGARTCSKEENPAEYMLEIIGAGAKGKSDKDWHAVWKSSPEAVEVQNELDRIHSTKANEPSATDNDGNADAAFAMPLSTQLREVTFRVFQQYWRTPEYLLGKMALVIISSLFISFTFYKPDQSIQGFQNGLFAIFMLTSIFASLVQQIMPMFVSQRALYEVRERPSKVYSWSAFLVANIFVEIPWQIFVGILSFASFYYPVFGRHQSSERQGLILLLVTQFYIFISSFSHFLISWLPDAETGGNVATFMFTMMLVFNGVFQTADKLPGFWIFMYRVSPLTYLVGGMAGTSLAGRAVICSTKETSVFDPPANQTCAEYLNLNAEGQYGAGVVYNPQATSGCRYCSLQSGDQYLGLRGITYGQRWRDYGIGWAFVIFNIAMAVLLYYAFRVQKFNPIASVGKLVMKAKMRGKKKA